MKVVFKLVKIGEFDFVKFFVLGGMLSFYVLIVIVFVIGVGVVEGVESLMFVVVIIFVIIVMYDVLGVRFVVSK